MTSWLLWFELKYLQKPSGRQRIRAETPLAVKQTTKGAHSKPSPH